MNWTEELGTQIGGQTLTDDATLTAYSQDFGHLVTKKPQAVVKPASKEEVASVVKFAAARGIAVGTRGAGHSQSGQSLSEGILLDMSALSQVTAVDEAALTVHCQAGISWRALLERLAPQRLSPPVLTNNLDVSVGGTMSTGGLGVASWRHGTQADNCLELEVVTGSGDVLVCSPQENARLFDAVRAGVGQFGIITAAKLRLRPHKPMVRTFYLLYDDLEAILADLKTVMSDERFDYLEAWCAPSAQGFKKIGGQRQPFAQWFFPLHATVEFEGMASPDNAAKLAGLRFYKHVHTEDNTISDFYARLDPLFALWKRGGFWEFPHPWMECVLPWQTTQMYLKQILDNTPPQAILGGHILLWPARGTVSSVPLFMRPKDDYLMGFGILPAYPAHILPEALPKLNMASQASSMMGGKRYLSGHINFSAAQWKTHYGDKWTTVLELKKEFDPRGILNPGFVKYE
jgi:cytokinin dehydrogenase